MAYRLSRKAEEDILEIFASGAERFGVRQAELYHIELEHRFRFLAENPLAARVHDELHPPIRIYPFASHLIVYNVLDDGEVYIIRVRHGHEAWWQE
ncbi:MAG: type II toxin-antitoxin system RelE/ParE family toxin [Gammaproteobacteria bacterium]|nr:type II toxin-antitoxin system RelE/ParE family toxin [Gammaproteobacteria bacterium]